MLNIEITQDEQDEVNFLREATSSTRERMGFMDAVGVFCVQPTQYRLNSGHGSTISLESHLRVSLKGQVSIPPPLVCLNSHFAFTLCISQSSKELHMLSHLFPLEVKLAS